jgi:hypothetical protein
MTIESPVQQGYLPQTLGVATIVRELYGGTWEFGVSTDKWVEFMNTLESIFGETIARVYQIGHEQGFYAGQSSVMSDPYVTFEEVQ